jgi:hypothetical protein
MHIVNYNSVTHTHITPYCARAYSAHHIHNDTNSCTYIRRSIIMWRTDIISDTHQRDPHAISNMGGLNTSNRGTGTSTEGPHPPPPSEVRASPQQTKTHLCPNQCTRATAQTGPASRYDPNCPPSIHSHHAVRQPPHARQDPTCDTHMLTAHTTRDNNTSYTHMTRHYTCAYIAHHIHNGTKQSYIIWHYIIM